MFSTHQISRQNPVCAWCPWMTMCITCSVLAHHSLSPGKLLFRPNSSITRLLSLLHRLAHISSIRPIPSIYRVSLYKFACKQCDFLNRSHRRQILSLVTNFVTGDKATWLFAHENYMLHSTSHLEIDRLSIYKRLVEQYFLRSMHRRSCCLVLNDKICLMCGSALGDLFKCLIDGHIILHHISCFKE